MTEKNVWDAVENAQAPPRTYFGRIHMDVWFCVLTKGIGREPFDPATHRADQKRISVDVELVPLPSSNLKFTVERNMIAESREWAGIVLPSIKACGVSPKDLHEKWARADLVPTGRTYQSNGETKEATTFKFLQVFNTEAECQAAADALFGASDDDKPIPGFEDPAPINGEKATAAAFLPALWKQSGQDVTAFINLIAGNPLTSKHFTLNSPEVLAIVTE